MQGGQHVPRQNQRAHNQPLGHGGGASTLGRGHAEVRVVVVGAVGKLVGTRREELDPLQAGEAEAGRRQLCRVEVDGRLVKDILGNGRPLIAEIAVDLQGGEVSRKMVQFVFKANGWGAFPRG